MSDDQIYVSPIYEELDKYGIVNVPMKIPTEENFKEYGRFVHDFDKEEVWIEQWPATGTRPVAAGTGIHGGVGEGDYSMAWEGDFLMGHLRAVNHKWTLARRPNDVTDTDRTHCLVWDINYHPDGGQVFYPTEGKAFVALLALPGDEIKPEDFVAFYFDGSCGVQVRPNVWHTGMLPSGDENTYRDKQGRVFACVRLDTIAEQGKFLRVPLKMQFAEME